MTVRLQRENSIAPSARWRRLVLIGAVTALAAGCSSSREEAKDPAADDPAARSAARPGTTADGGTVTKDPGLRKTPPGAKKDYPNLASVPRTRPDTGTTQQRLEIEEGLYADRRNARYVEGPVAGDEERNGGRATTTRDVQTRFFTPGTGPVAGVRRGARRQAEPRLRPVDGVGLGRGGYSTTIVFPNGSTGMPPGAGRRIVRVSQLHRVTGGTIRVIGHSAKGEPAANSVARANLVANGLASLGVPRSKIKVAGVGARQPRFKDNAKNSRVDIYIVGIRVRRRR